MIKSIIFRIIAWMVNIFLIIIISLLFYINIPVYTQKTLHIPNGSVTKIISYLTKKGHSLTIIDRYLLVLIGEPKTGWIDMKSTKMNRIDFLINLTKSKFSISKITLIPGETTYIFLNEIALQLKLDSDKLFDEYNKTALFKEAGIFADTYHIPKGIKEKNLIEFLTRESNKRYKKLYKKLAKDKKFDQKEFNKVLTIASIIQKEAANNKEMPIIASVIYNRIAKNMRLQMDGSLNYGKYSHIKITPKRIKTDMTKFNTYKFKGLPDYPVCNVSTASIKATFNPASTNYLYFMKNSNNTHDFSKTYKEHRKYIQKAKAN